MNTVWMRKHLFKLALLALSWGIPTIASADEAVAMVTDIAGICTVNSNNTENKCEILTYLYQGDELQFKKGSKLTLAFFADSAEYNFSGKGTIKIGEKSPIVTTGKNPNPRTLLLAKETGLGPAVSADYAQAAIVLRGSGMQKKLALVRPNNTNVLSHQPEFAWKPVDSNVQYRFILTDESGKILVDEKTREVNHSLPRGIKLAEDAYYTWQVEAKTSSGEKYSNTADFLVVDRAERNRIEKLRPGNKAPISEKVLFAAVLEQSGFQDAAYDEWKKLAAQKPGDPILSSKATRK